MVEAMHCNTILLIIVLLFSESQCDHQEALASLLLDFVRHFYSGCSYLFYMDTGTDTNVELVLKLQKLLSNLKLQTTAVAIQNFLPTIAKLSCKINSPTYIFLSRDVTFSYTLSQLNALMPQAFWLLVLPPGEQPGKDLLSGVNVPIDCEFLVLWEIEEAKFQIMEVYRISKQGPLERQHYGYWDPDSRSQGWPDLEIWKRRNDLKGLTFHATTIEAFSSQPETEISGSVGQLWKLLEKNMNFSTRVTPPPDNAWGSVNLCNEWNGMVAMLQHNQVDVAVDNFMMTSERAGVMDFTTPMLLTRFYWFVEEPETTHSDWNSHMKPFSGRLWAAILGMIFAMVLCLTSLRLLDKDIHTLHNSLFYVMAAIFQQSHEPLPRWTSGRLLVTTMYLTSVVLVAAYSATLTSFLAIQTLRLPFTDLEGLLTSGYRLDVIDKSAELNLFTNSKNQLITRVYNQALEPHQDQLPTDEFMGLRNVCRNKRRVFFAPAVTTMAAVTMANCSLAAIPADMFKATLAMGFVKNSSYRGMTNYNINILRSTGILRRLATGKIQISKTNEKHLPEVDLERVTPLLVEFAAGVLVSVMLLAAEHLVSRLQQSRSRSFINKTVNLGTLNELINSKTIQKSDMCKQEDI